MSPVRNRAKMNTANTDRKSTSKVISNGMSKTVVLKPRMSEKAYGTSLALNTYVFDVPVTANKMMITAAVQEQFGVTVQDVKVVVVKGKVKKSYQKRNRPVAGVRAKAKKAYVRLAEGSSINIFGEAEDKSAKTDKQDEKKTAKKDDKKEKK